MLVILGGLPGVGKSSICKAVAKKLGAFYLRIDSIEQAIRNAFQLQKLENAEVFAEGYMAAYAIAKDNLEIGLSVIADSVNPIELTRNDYRQIALATKQPYLEVEIICSNKDTHQKRVETRRPTIKGHKLPSWQDVLDRDYETWDSKHLTIDTANITIDEAVETIIKAIDQQNRSAIN